MPLFLLASSYYCIVAMASILISMASSPIAMASNLIEMASNLVASCYYMHVAGQGDDTLVASCY